ncbi:hypothetical protein ACFODL_02230 [Phenylobacterium terrae]|uniref:Lipoprotein n=1 Tax=Phenylobacterium terrae TaxID=2665495 RepID=A0ABW4N3X6_9CAUL
MRSALVIAALALSACGTGQRYEQALNDTRISDAVGAYEVARTRGDPLDLCVKARLVAIAYEDAGRAAERDAWRAKETGDCRAAQARYAGARSLD